MAIPMTGAFPDDVQRCSIDATLDAVEKMLTRHKLVRDQIRAGNLRVAEMAVDGMTPSHEREE